METILNKLAERVKALTARDSRLEQMLRDLMSSSDEYVRERAGWLLIDAQLVALGSEAAFLGKE